MSSAVLPCVVQSCAAVGPSPRGGLFRSSSSRDGQGQAPAVLGRVSMTPPSSLGRHRQQVGAAAAEQWPGGDPAPQLRRLVAPPSSLTVPVAGEWLERGPGRSPDLPVVHYCNANVVHGGAGGCIHIRGMSESSTPTGPPVPPQRRQLSSSGEASTVTASPSSPPASRSLAARDGAGASREGVGEQRRGPRADGPSQYDIDAIMRELAVDVERIVDAASSAGGRGLVDQSVQTSNPGHQPHPAAFTHLLPADLDHRPRRTTGHAAMQPPLGAAKFSSVREPSRPTNLTRSNGVVANDASNDASRRSFGVVGGPVSSRDSPPPLLPPPTHDDGRRQRDAHPLQRGVGPSSSAFKPVPSAAAGNHRAAALTNSVDQPAFRPHAVPPGVGPPRAEPVRRRGPPPESGRLVPAPSFRVRRSVGVTSLPRLCRSLENIASDVDDSAPRSGTSSRADSPAAAAAAPPGRRRGAPDNHHQLLLLHPDDVSLSSFDGTASELSRSDPALSSYGGETSEYDNYRPGMASDEDYFVPEPVSDVDIDLFDDVDIDDVEVSDTYAALQDAVAIPPPPLRRQRILDDV